jgi:hypothetical protein
MKMLLFKMVFVVSLLLAGPYFMMNGGKMPDFISDLLDPTAKKAKLPENVRSVVTDEEVTVYKWVDAQGNTHFSSVKPMNQTSETKHLKPDTNVMQAVKIPEAEESDVEKGFAGLISLRKGEKNSKKGGGKGDGKVEPYQMENPYTPEGMQNLIQGAQNIQGLVDQRDSAQKKTLDK